MIRFRGASVTYRAASDSHGVRALRDLDLEIAPGEFVVVVGLSGAGKSTLIRAINGLVPLTSGSLEVNGREVTQLPKAGLRELLVRRLATHHAERDCARDGESRERSAHNPPSP